jgi:uncharacterized protein with PIN domain
LIGPKFIADAMLGSLARKLRVFGFDTEYYSGNSDLGLVALARRRGRLVLTSDRLLAALAESKGATSVLILGRTDGQRLQEIAMKTADLRVGLEPGPSRCAVCNGELRASSRAKLRGILPDRVVDRHRLFFSCTKCGRVYWRGGHWKKLRRLRRRLRPKESRRK